MSKKAKRCKTVFVDDVLKTAWRRCVRKAGHKGPHKWEDD